MSPSGKFFRFNIGSTVSFQLKAGFASISRDELQPGNQLNPHQGKKVDGSRRRDLDAEQHQQANFYEIIDLHTDGSPDPTQTTYPATLSLAERTAIRAALESADTSSDNRDTTESYHRKVQRKLADRNAEYMEYIQSYDRNGQKIIGVFELPVIDFVI
jgi:hypothetical protein